MEFKRIRVTGGELLPRCEEYVRDCVAAEEAQIAPPDARTFYRSIGIEDETAAPILRVINQEIYISLLPRDDGSWDMPIQKAYQISEGEYNSLIEQQ